MNVPDLPLPSVVHDHVNSPTPKSQSTWQDSILSHSHLSSLPRLLGGMPSSKEFKSLATDFALLGPRRRGTSTVATVASGWPLKCGADGSETDEDVASNAYMTASCKFALSSKRGSMNCPSLRDKPSDCEATSDRRYPCTDPLVSGIEHATLNVLQQMVGGECDLQTPFAVAGLDSHQAHRFVIMLRENPSLRVLLKDVVLQSLDITMMYNYPTPRSLAQHLTALAVGARSRRSGGKEPSDKEGAGADAANDDACRALKAGLHCLRHAACRCVSLLDLQEHAISNSRRRRHPGPAGTTCSRSPKAPAPRQRGQCHLPRHSGLVNFSATRERGRAVRWRLPAESGRAAAARAPEAVSVVLRALWTPLSSRIVVRRPCRFRAETRCPRAAASHHTVRWFFRAVGAAWRELCVDAPVHSSVALLGTLSEKAALRGGQLRPGISSPSPGCGRSRTEAASVAASMSAQAVLLHAVSRQRSELFQHRSHRASQPLRASAQLGRRVQLVPANRWLRVPWEARRPRWKASRHGWRRGSSSYHPLAFRTSDTSPHRPWFVELAPYTADVSSVIASTMRTVCFVESYGDRRTKSDALLGQGGRRQTASWRWARTRSQGSRHLVVD